MGAFGVSDPIAGADGTALNVVGKHLLSGGGGGECEELEVESDVVLFTFFMVMLGLITIQLFTKIPIPYTAQLLIIGLGFGFLHKELMDVPKEDAVEGDEKASGVRRLLSGGGIDVRKASFNRGYDRLGIGVQLWTDINPELLLLLFLPALIFASAFSLQFHILKRVIIQVLLLAGPGVVIGTGLVALFAKYVFPYNWCWPKALLFGSMMAATDPVAVVALLKEVGASAKLGHVIEGESLFNDGTAFVFFLLFRDMIPFTDDCLDDEGGPEPFEPICKTDDRSLGQSIEFFIQLALGGPALGVGMGILATLWIKCIFNNLVVEISLTFVTAYLGFYLAEDVIEVSGVLTVVGLGIFMGAFARDRVSSIVHGPMHVFWEMMEFFANTMIFIFTGVKVAIEIYEGHNSTITGSDWGYAIALYVALNIIRGLTVLILYPIMMNLGYGLTWKDALVMVWGGLRGAVGLALALIVELDRNKLPPEFRALTIFHMGLMAAATLVINGTSMPYLLKMLGTTKTAPEKLEVLLHVVKDLEDCDPSFLEYDPLLGDANREKVVQISNIDVRRVIPLRREVQQVLTVHPRDHPSLVGIEAQLTERGLARMSAPPATGTNGQTVVNVNEKKSKGMLGVIKKLVGSGRRSQMEVSKVEVTSEMLVKDLRSRFLQGVKATYAEWLDESLIGANQSFDLREATDKMLDELEHPLCDWKYLEEIARVPSWRVYIQKFAVFSHFAIVRTTIQRILFSGVEHTVLCARALIHAHCEAEHTITEHIQIGKHSDGDSTMLIKLREAGERVIAESRQQSDMAQEFVKKIKRAYPEITRSIKTKMVAQHILTDKLQYVTKLHKAGLIESREAEELETLIAKKMKKLAFHPPQLKLPQPKDLLHSHPLFSDISRTVFLSEVMPYAKHKVYEHNQNIFTVGSVALNVTLVIRGLVHILLPDGTAHRQEGTGAIIGMSEVLLNQLRARSLIADTVVEVYQIEAEVFRGLVAKHEALWKRAWQMAAVFLTVLHPWGDFKGMSYQQIQTHIRHADILRFNKDDDLTVDGDYFLLQGKLMEVKLDGSQIGSKEHPAALGPGPTYYVCQSLEAMVARIPKFALGGTTPGPGGSQPPELRRFSMVQAQLSRTSLSRRLSQRPRRRHESLHEIPEDPTTDGHPAQTDNDNDPRAPGEDTGVSRAESAPPAQTDAAVERSGVVGMYGSGQAAV